MALVSITIQRPSGYAPKTVSRRRRIGFVAALAGVVSMAAFGLLDGSAHAAGIVSITPHALQTNTAVAAGKSVTPVVSGGATTIPTDATRVEFSVSVAKPQASGTLAAYPAGSPTQGVGSVAFAQTTGGSGTLTESVGLSNKVTFVNNSSGSVTLTVKIIGFSTQVLASDIAPTGGVSGQVLTNTGAGATWQTPGRGYESDSPGVSLPAGSFVAVAHLSIPAGSYLLSFNATVANDSGHVADVSCQLTSPTNVIVQEAGTSVGGGGIDQVYLGAEGLMSGAAGQADMECAQSGALAGQVSFEAPELVATTLGATSITSS